MLPLEGDIFQNGMEYIEKDVKEKWKERGACRRVYAVLVA